MSLVFLVSTIHNKQSFCCGCLKFLILMIESIAVLNSLFSSEVDSLLGINRKELPPRNFSVTTNWQDLNEKLASR